MKKKTTLILAFLILFSLGLVGDTTLDEDISQAKKPRARDLGIEPGVFPPGPYNAITDVPGVLVGHTTIRKGDNVRTGVTAVLPHGGNIFREKVTGAVFVGNAFGKLAGSTQVNELGLIEVPIILTNTLSVGRAMEATEEAVYNGLFQATTTTGMGETYEPIPIDKVKEILKKYGRGK